MMSGKDHPELVVWNLKLEYSNMSLYSLVEGKTLIRRQSWSIVFIYLEVLKLLEVTKEQRNLKENYIGEYMAKWRE